MNWEVFHSYWPQWPPVTRLTYDIVLHTQFLGFHFYFYKLCKWQLTLYTQLWISLCFILPFTKCNIPVLTWHPTRVLLSCHFLFSFLPKALLVRMTSDQADPWACPSKWEWTAFWGLWSDVHFHQGASWGPSQGKWSEGVMSSAHCALSSKNFSR